MPTRLSFRRLMGLGLAGALCLSVLPNPATGTDQFVLERMAGETRWDTSALIASEFVVGDTAILVNGERGRYADGLSATYLAGVLEAPILLTRTSSTPRAVLDQLERRAVRHIVVVGGEAVVSRIQVAALEDAGYVVERVSGKDRYATSARVVAAGRQATDGLGIVASGQDFADALAGGPLAFQEHPLGLTRKDAIDASVMTALKAAGVSSVYVLGGTGAVSDAVVDELQTSGIDVRKRLGGGDRSETAAALARELVAQHGFSPNSVAIASGEPSFYGADALSGGPLAGQLRRPLLVTRTTSDPGAVMAFLADQCESLHQGMVFGGESAVARQASGDMGAMGKSCDTGDVAAPVLTHPQAVAEGSTVTASVTVTDDVGVTAVSVVLATTDGRRVASKPATSGAADVYTAVFTGLVPGTYKVSFVASDMAANVMSAVSPPVEVLGSATSNR